VEAETNVTALFKRQDSAFVEGLAAQVAEAVKSITRFDETGLMTPGRQRAVWAVMARAAELLRGA
jgi:hypothetical protein